MVLNISGQTIAKQVVRGFTPGGFRLITKETTNVLPKSAPNGAFSANIAMVETDFGKGMTDVVSYFDKKGKLIAKVLTKTSGSNVVRKTVTYQGSKNAVTTRTSVTSVNGVDTQKKISNYLLVEQNGTPVMTRETLTRDYVSDGSRAETQVFENLSTQGRRTYLQTNAIRTPDGTLINKSVHGNAASSESLKKLADNPYLYVKSYPKDEFVMAISPYAKDLQKVADVNPEIVIEKLEGKDLGLSYGGKIVVDTAKHSFKSELVDTLNHELRHEYQSSLISKLPEPSCRITDDLKIEFLNNSPKKECSLFKKILNKLGLTKDKNVKLNNEVTLSNEEKELGRNFRLAKEFYVPPEVRYESYWNNLREVDARQAGEAAAIEFETMNKNLSSWIDGLDMLEWSPKMFKFLSSL